MSSHDPQALAAEVVALEEQVLQLKSSHLRDRSQASGASEVARAMQVHIWFCFLCRAGREVVRGCFWGGLPLAGLAAGREGGGGHMWLLLGRLPLAGTCSKG